MNSFSPSLVYGFYYVYIFLKLMTLDLALGKKRILKIRKRRKETRVKKNGIFAKEPWEGSS